MIHLLQPAPKLRDRMPTINVGIPTKASVTLVRFVLCSAIFLSQNCFAQTETFDITTFQLPKEWKRTNGQGYVMLQDHKTGNDAGFCIVVVYSSRNSSGDVDKDFQQEWNDLVVNPNGDVSEPKIEKEKTADGWMALTGTTTLNENGVDYALMLVTASGFGKVTSVLIKVAGESYIPVIQNFLGTMQLSAKDNPQKPMNESSATVTNSTAPSDKKIIGSWGKVYSVVGAYTNDLATNLAFSGYKRGQYIFKADGTYSFQGENWGGTVNNEKFKLKNNKEWGLIDEIGTYQQTGNKLTIFPSKNIYRVVKEDGTLLRSETLSLEKREYTWQTYYAVGMEENRLVLTASKENFFDGDFSTYEPAVSFPSSFCYTLDKKMFFKFLPASLAAASSLSTKSTKENAQ